VCICRHKETLHSVVGIAAAVGTAAGVGSLLLFKNTALLRHVLARRPLPRPTMAYPSLKGTAFAGAGGALGGIFYNSGKIEERNHQVELEAQQQQQQQQYQQQSEAFPYDDKYTLRG